jgi:hypothetical protein
MKQVVFTKSQQLFCRVALVETQLSSLWNSMKIGLTEQTPGFSQRLLEFCTNANGLVTIPPGSDPGGQFPAL